MAKQNAQKQSARERAAALKAQQEAKERRQRLILAGATLGIIALIVIGLVVAALTKGDGSSSTATPASQLSSTSQKALTSVTPAELDAVGVGSVTNFPNKLKTAQDITSAGKPQVLYVGAEYCPYCAGLRWSTAIAMNRFGTWSPLQTTSSSAEDVFPNTATLSFSKKSGAKLTSDVIDFVSYETATNTRKNGTYGKLDDLGGTDRETFEKLDAAPYVSEQSAGSIPFISFGGKAIQAGGIYDTTVLQGKTADQIAAALKNPKDPITQGVLGGANAITAATCEATGGKPAEVCTAAGVKAAAARLGSAG